MHSVATMALWLAVLVLASCGGRSPVAWVDPAGAIGPDQDSAAVGRALELTLVSLSEARAARMARAIDSATAAAARKDNPFVDDISDADERMETALRTGLPMLTAAVHLAHARYATDDGVHVTVGASCREAPPGARCVKLWDRPSPDDDLHRRLRLLAWPYSFSVVLRAGEADVPALVRALREAGEQPESAIALVLDPGERAAPGRGDSLREAARRGLDRAEASHREVPEILRTLAVPATSGDGARQLGRLFSTRSGEVVVVPRLGVLVRLESLDAEIERTVAALPFSVRRAHDLVPP